MDAFGDGELGEAEMPEWFKDDDQRGDAEKALKDKINNTKANEFQVMCPNCSQTYDTFAKDGKCEYCGADNNKFYGNESRRRASEEEVPTSMGQYDRDRIELRNQDAETVVDDEDKDDEGQWSKEGRGDTYGRHQENLWPEHTDETQCITCGRSVSDHANPNTDYRGMDGSAPETDHYFQGGDLGGSDDKLYFESKASEGYEEDHDTIKKLLKKNGSVTFEDFLAQDGDYPQDLGEGVTDQFRDQNKGITDKFRDQHKTGDKDPPEVSEGNIFSDLGSDYQKAMDKSLGLLSVSSHYDDGNTCNVCGAIPNDKREHLRNHYGAYFDQTIASEDVTFAGRTEINNMEDLWNGASQNGRMSMLGELGWGSDMPAFEMEQFARRPWSEVKGSLEYLGEMEANFNWMKNIVGYESLQFSYDDEEKVKDWSERVYHKSWDSMTDEEKARQEDQYRDRNAIKDVTSADEAYTYDEIKADLDSQTKEERRITKEIFDTLGYDSLDQDGKTSLDILRKEFGGEASSEVKELESRLFAEYGKQIDDAGGMNEEKYTYGAFLEDKGYGWVFNWVRGSDNDKWSIERKQGYESRRKAKEDIYDTGGNAEYDSGQIKNPRDILEEWNESTNYDPGQLTFYNWQTYAQNKGLTQQEIDSEWDDWGLEAVSPPIRGGSGLTDEQTRDVGYGFRDAELRDEYRHFGESHNGHEYTCGICSDKFGDEAEYTDHKIAHDMDGT